MPESILNYGVAQEEGAPCSPRPKRFSRSAEGRKARIRRLRWFNPDAMMNNIGYIRIWPAKTSTTSVTSAKLIVPAANLSRPL